jgi:hypothetical protein
MMPGWGSSGSRLSFRVSARLAWVSLAVLIR